MRSRLAFVAWLASACGLEVVGVGAPDGAGPGAAPTADAAAPSTPAPSPSGASSVPSAEPDAQVPPPAPPPDASTTCTADLQTSLAHCGACNAACPASTTKCEAGKCIATLRVRVGIDGQSWLRVSGASAKWFHAVNAAPGRHADTPTPLQMNGTAFSPAWPDSGGDLENRNCNCESSALPLPVAALPGRAQTVQLQVVEKRKTLEIAEQPSAANAYRLSVHFDDVGHGGSAYYEGILTYETR